MEKYTPHCPLRTVKVLLEAGKVRITTTALIGAEMLGLDFDMVVSIVMGLSERDFYKSMTSHNNHKIWQDVYRPITEAGEVYLKLIVIDDVLILSFKEL